MSVGVGQLRLGSMERGRSDEVEPDPQSHAERCLALAEAAEPKLRGPEQAAWLHRLEQEHDELRAALAWSLNEPEAGDTPPATGAQARATDAQVTDVGLRLAGALPWFWFVHSHLGEGRRWLERALATSGRALAPVRVKAVFGLGRLALELGDVRLAAARFEEGLALTRELGDSRGIAVALGGLALVAHARGAYGRALARLDQ